MFYESNFQHLRSGTLSTLPSFARYVKVGSADHVSTIRAYSSVLPIEWLYLPVRSLYIDFSS